MKVNTAIFALKKHGTTRNKTSASVDRGEHQDGVSSLFFSQCVQRYFGCVNKYFLTE